jgi:molybdate transport system permease protein
MIWAPVILSLQVSALATVCALPIAIWVAFILARKRFWGHGLLNGLVHLPLVLPPVVTGYLLLVVFGRQGAVGSLLYDLLGLRLVLWGFR